MLDREIIEEQEKEIKRLKKLILINKYSADTLQDSLVVYSVLPRAELVQGLLTSVSVMSNVLYCLTHDLGLTDKFTRNAPFMKLYNSYVSKMKQ